MKQEKLLKDYEAPKVEVIEFTLSEDIAASMDNGGANSTETFWDSWD